MAAVKILLGTLVNVHTGAKAIPFITLLTYARIAADTILTDDVMGWVTVTWRLETFVDVCIEQECLSIQTEWPGN